MSPSPDPKRILKIERPLLFGIDIRVLNESWGINQVVAVTNRRA